MRLRENKTGVITLLIADNGRGLQRSRPSTASLGLAGMAERMQAISGKLHLRSSHGHGVVIRAQYRPPSVQNIEARASEERHEYSL